MHLPDVTVFHNLAISAFVHSTVARSHCVTELGIPQTAISATVLYFAGSTHMSELTLDTQSYQTWEIYKQKAVHSGLQQCRIPRQAILQFNASYLKHYGWLVCHVGFRTCM